MVRERSFDRCEYCLIPESVSFAAHCIDHIVAEKHGGVTDPDNLANSCLFCNQRKGSDLSSIDYLTGDVAILFNPRRDRWAEHFRLAGARIDPLTPTGRATERLLQFNHPDRVEEREQLVSAGLLSI
jgi:hypothetical protein